MHFKFKKSKIYQNWSSFKFFLKTLDVNIAAICLPAMLAFIASIFEAASLGLLIPTMKGIIQTDFSFVKKMPVLEPLIKFLPSHFEERNAALFMSLVALIFLAAVFKNIFQYISYLTTVIQVRKVANNLRKKIYDKYMSFNKAFFDRNNAGYLHQVLMGHTNQISSQMKTMQIGLYGAFSLLVYLVLMFIVSWKLTIFVCLAFPTLIFSLRWLIHRIAKTSEHFSESYLNLAGKISNSLSCIPLVKASTNEQHEREWFNHASNQVENLEVSMDKKLLLVSPMQEMILLVLMLLLVSAMAMLFVREGQGEIAGYLIYFLILRRAMGTFGIMNEILGALASIRGPIREVMKVFQNDESNNLKNGVKVFKGLKKRISFIDVSFEYRKNVPILKDFNLEIEKGKMTAIVGSTGAGKTTLISLLMRFYDVHAGMIFYDDIDIKDFTLDSLREHIAWVSQDMLLFNTSLKANLTYGIRRTLTEEELQKTLKKARLDEFISRLPEGLETEIGDRGVQLSSGEKQRVAIARALLKNSEILILDEATSALDSKTENLIQDALDEIFKNRTSVVIAHRLSTIKHADKIVVLERGSIVEEGSLNDLIDRKGRFYYYWQQQNFFTA